MPLVSVIVPTYQNGQYLCQAIESILRQTWKDLEIIVVDDGSTDNTSEVLKTYEGKIKILTQPNSGTAAARNAGIKVSQGKFIAFLDADDIWLEGKLEQQMPIFDKKPQVGLVFSDMYNFDGESKKGRAFQLVKPKSGWVESDLFQSDFVPMPTVIIRHECLDTIGLFDETLHYCEDYDLWLRICRSWELDFINEPLALYRLSQGQKSKNRRRMVDDTIQIKRKAISENAILKTLPRPILDKCFYNLYLQQARLALTQNCNLDARKYMKDYYAQRGFSLRYCIMTLLCHIPYRVNKSALPLWDNRPCRK
jgi:glycosyltransferase involved in cell wall biosynthesis